MDPQQASRARPSYQNAPEFHYANAMMPGMDMQLPPLGASHDSSHARPNHPTYDSGSAAAAAAAAQHHRASIGSGANHSPRMVTGQSPQQGHPAMFSQGPSAHGYGGPQQQQQQQQQQQYGNPTLTGGAPHQAYQQQVYGAPYGQHPGQQQQQHSASPHQHYSHIPGSSVGLGAGQFGSPGGGPMMGGGGNVNDYSLQGHPSYTHMHHPGSGAPGGPQHAYGAHFQMPGGMQHLQHGGSGMMMPGGHQMAMGQNPMAIHGPGAGSISGQAIAPGGGMNRGSGAGGAMAGRPKQDGQGAGSGRGRKSKKAIEAAAAAAAAQSVVGMPGMMAMQSSMKPDMGKMKGVARHHPYGMGEVENGKGMKKAKKEEPPKPPVLKSHLKPPKQAPSAWQVYFTEELQKMKLEQPGERLNVAHVAKDAGQRYAALPEEKKKEFQRKSLEAKAEWEREMEAWRQTLTPEDIKQENMFRTAQRKAGKSRKGNLKDPNAPKKPLSAYFLFLRAIRADPGLTQSVFEGEQETTKQSVLAASKWRALPEGEKQPYLEKAEADKSEYERLRREYEATHTGELSRKSGAKYTKPDDSDDDDDVEHGLGGVDDEDPSHVGDHVDDHFKIDAPFHEDHFIGAPLDDHFGTNPDGSSLKPEDLM